ncbi:succinate dehydrogenase/fumarate reductase, cytochrome b subunit [Methylomarinovum tepidoasis]|uniref:Succinate dehydrogenase cytochrome b556 subunit n=1 Tax=Methylomarinovum tepidoasis TaxID=2840183 RepID=A0AAU9CGC3_9GAMM|nr:succinate dehydrogenase, cytochrome b556 subunit [Methylomarinovum sp. IN45]BCX89941.1 succinate dehydrogenase/fumarate reductase, cytochrome b subunit [Methylomarinovum sp. IN45]
MNRPLSPHLQIYRLPLTAWLSITHRITGVVLSFGLLVLVGMVLAIAGAGEGYGALQAFLHGFWGRVWLFLWLLALFSHFCHGIRHLLWDVILGFERERLSRHSLLELLAALGLTCLAWLWI